MRADRVDVAIITVREDEADALLSRLPSPRPVRRNGHLYSYARLTRTDGRTISIALVRLVEQGASDAQSTTENLLEDWRPRWILVVGIAGAVPSTELSLGDVLLASRLHAFAIGAVDPPGHLTFNDQGGPVARPVAEVLRILPNLKRDYLLGWNSTEAIGERPRIRVKLADLYGSDAWRKQTAKALRSCRLRGHPIALAGAIGTTPFVVKSPELVEDWQKTARSMLGFEMELAGVFAGARRHDPDYPVLAIRGISDVIGCQRNPDWTAFACNSAASLCVSLLANVPAHVLFSDRASGQGAAITPDPRKPGIKAEAKNDTSRAGDLLPPLELLDGSSHGGDITMDHSLNATLIEKKLASFSIPAKVTHWDEGPVVTQYEVQPSPNAKIGYIEALADDLAMALAARTVRVATTTTDRGTILLEVPNRDFNVVALRSVLEGAHLGGASKLTFALGRDSAGQARTADLARMPHLLIGGKAGSGKTVMVNAIIVSLLCNATPEEVRLVLIDLKRAGLAAYTGVPHLMAPVITSLEHAKAALKWAVAEMKNRQDRMSLAGARNIADFTSRAGPSDRMPYLVIVIDELADLMVSDGRTVEESLVRLAQGARATGIHVVLGTQQPSYSVVTMLIRLNFPSRIAFAMASQADSRTILDVPGAEELIGRGDMLFQPADLPRPIRVQGVFVSDAEIAKITNHWRTKANPHYNMAIVDHNGMPTWVIEEPCCG